MNNVLRPFLRRFILVFFDDIMIYSKTWVDHLRHLRAVLDELRRHQLFVKRNKCSFATSSVAYLAHVISAAGVAMDPAKVQAIHEWPAPRSTRAVRGFLGLAGYYRKFVHNYGAIAAPLPALLKKEGFSWGDAAVAAFTALKAAVTSAPVLAIRSLSSAGQWRRATARLLHTSVSSSASSRQYDTGGRISGGGASSSKPTTTV
jgi:hypothetical protein